MKRRLLHLFLPAICIFAALTACNDVDTTEFYNGSGLLQVSLQMPDGAPAEEAFSLTLRPLEGTPGVEHTWPSFTEFRQGQRYVSGAYTVVASTGTIDSEGFDAVWYEGQTTVNIAEGKTTSVSLPVELCSALLRVSCSENYRQQFPDATCTVHVPGGHFVTYACDETRPAAFRPGRAVISVTPLPGVDLLLTRDLQLAKGSETSLQLDYLTDTQQILLVDARGDVLRAIDADPAALAAPAPEVQIFGPQQIVVQEFGDAPQQSGFIIDGAADAILNICSPILRKDGAPAEIDIFSPDAAGAAFLTKAGITFDGKTLSLGNLTRILNYTEGLSPITELTLTAFSPGGKMSQPKTITITTLPLGVSVTAVHSAVIGVNKAVVEVTSDIDLRRDKAELSAFMIEGNSGRKALEVLSVETMAETGRYQVVIQLPRGTADVTVELMFNGQRVGEFLVPRISPEFTVEADAFACNAVLRVVASDDQLRSFIVENATVMVNNENATVMGRDPERGTITVTGLQSAGKYDAVLRLQPEGEGIHCRFTTEHARGLPNGDFEDTKESVKTGRIPSGGRYSQTIVPIFNSQNTGGYHCDAPVKWANTNAKTCGEGWKTPNTWYMHPSVMSTDRNPASGDMAVILQSTAFDPDGETIPDFLQTAEPYTPYSQNIPNIRYRAAGRLFLGTYRFDPATMTESYQPGINFDARPSSLNGYFKYLPSEADATDRGLVEVRVLDAAGRVLASGSVRLAAANSWTAFAVPLTYNLFGVKAARLEVTIASSASIGTIEQETRSVHTFDDVRTATSLGSTLYIDNLSLAY